MTTRRALVCTLAIALLAAGAALASTPLQEGIWDGAITQPNGVEESVEFEVREVGGELRLTLLEGEAGVPLGTPRIEEGDLVFDWQSGASAARCTLEPQDDGSYAGPCRGLDLRMTPPAATP